MKAWLQVALFTTALIVGGAAACAVPDAQPYKTMRTLQGLEDRIATGDTLAKSAHDKAMSRVGHDFAAMPPDVWQDVRNARSLVIYLFSGGNGAIIAQAIPTRAVNKDVAALFEGAVAYSTAEDERARHILLAIDAHSLPAGVAGHLALVQAALCESSDKKRAITLLDLARLLEPGTLVEEAALRKEMSLLEEAGDIDKLVLLSRRYQAIFTRSVYADNYRQLLAGLAKHAAEANTEAGNTRLGQLVTSLAKDERRRLLLAIARREVVAGHLTSATFAATAAGKLAMPGDREEARATLYFGAAAIVGDRYDLALASLNGVTPGKLEPTDVILRASALDVAASLHAVSVETSQATPALDGELTAKGDKALHEAADVLGAVRR